MASLDEIGVLLEAFYAPAPPAATWQTMGEAKQAELDALRSPGCTRCAAC